MAKIHKTHIYPFDTIVTVNDYVIGTDFDNSKKTKSYRIGNILSLVDGYTPNSAILSGNVYWLQGLDFKSTEIIYRLNGALYIAPITEITLEDADPLLDRIDTFVVNANGDIDVLEGVPSENPLQPQPIPGEQLFVSFAYIPAAATEPQDAEILLIYNEFTGQPTEWTTTEGETNGTPTIDLASTANPANLTTSIEADSMASTDEIVFRYDTPVNLFGSSFNFEFSNKSTKEYPLIFGFYNNNILIGTLRMNPGEYGFNPVIANQIQSVSVPSSAFAFLGGETIDAIRFSVGGASASTVDGFYIDYIRFVFGGVNPPAGGTYLALEDTEDTNYVGKWRYKAEVNESESGLILTKPVFYEIENALVRKADGNVNYGTIEVNDRVWHKDVLIAGETFSTNGQTYTNKDVDDNLLNGNNYENLIPTLL